MKSRFSPLLILAITSATSAIAQTYVSGLLHAPLGAATFGTADGRRLPVNNLGSSGQDGVEIQFDSVFGGGASVEIGPILTTPAATLRIRHKGWDGLIYGNHRLISNGNGTAELQFDFSPSSATALHIVEYNAAGGVVSDQLYPGPIAARPWVPNFYCADGSVPIISVMYFHGQVWIIWTCATSGPYTAGNPHGRIVITPTLPAGTPEPPIGAMDIGAAGVSGFVASLAQLETFDLPTWGLGQSQIAEFCADGTADCTSDQRKLQVTNIGSSGQDGVAVALPPNTGGVTVASAKGNCCRGHVIIMKLYDDTGAEQRIIRTQSNDPTDPNESIDADFSSLGAAGFRIRLFDAGGVVIGPPGGTAIISGGPRPMWTNRCPLGAREIWENQGTSGNPVWVFVGCLGLPFDFLFPGGISYTGVSSFSIEPLNPTLHTGALVRCEVTSEDPDGLVLESVSTTLAPPRCAGDANCDGAVNWRDIDFFVAGLNDNSSGWAARFPGGNPACFYMNLDTSGDGHVNWRDIDPFVARLNKTCN